MSQTTIQGHCDERFQQVADVFLENFEQRDEAGASVCVRVDGETVVDLWGGIRSRRAGAPWEQDTISLVFSNTKAAVWGSRIRNVACRSATR